MLTRDEIEFARFPDRAAGLAEGGPIWTPSAGLVPAPGRTAASPDLELENAHNTGLGSALGVQLDPERLGLKSPVPMRLASSSGLPGASAMAW